MSNKIIAKNCYINPDEGTFIVSSNDKAYSDFIKKNRELLNNFEKIEGKIEFITSNGKLLNKEVKAGFYTCNIEFDFIYSKMIIVEVISKNKKKFVWKNQIRS